MSQRAKGPRLYWHKSRGRWVVRDTGRPEVATGTDDRGEAEKFLARYIAAKDRPAGPVGAEEMTIATVLDIYGREHAPTVKAADRIGYAITALLPFWGRLPVTTIKGETCRRYAKTRTIRSGAVASAGTIRRELGTLRAALQYCVQEGYLLTAPPVTLPEKPQPRERWLTRDEAATLLRAARKSQRGSHLAHFILIGLYTGTRKSAILGLRFQPHATGGWVDVDQGLLYRKEAGKAETKKRQPPVRLPNRILAHLRRWQRNGAMWAVEYQGCRCGDIKTAWSGIREESGLDDEVVPHTLRHTSITWAMQKGATIWEASGFYGVSPEVIESVYGHHSQNHLETVRRAMDSR